MLDRGSFLVGAVLSSIFTFAATEAWSRGATAQGWLWAGMGILLILGIAFTSHLLSDD
jgi:hypothetical protein